MPKFDDLKQAPSEVFLSSLRNTGFSYGSSEKRCDCGRYHLAYLANEDAEECDVNWKTYCESLKEEEPDTTIIDYDSDFIRSTNIAGRNFVIGCECNGLSRYESFIWNNRQLIREYLKIRIDQEYQWLEEEKSLNKLAGLDNKKYDAVYGR